MNQDLNKLYPEIIKTHNELPFHFEKANHLPFTLKAYNPVCGDRFELYLEKKDEQIERLYFHGFGCAISKASTSVMVKALSGKSSAEALSICNQFLGFMDQRSNAHALPLPDDFQAFAGVHEFPERYECVTLSWKALKMFLETP